MCVLLISLLIGTTPFAIAIATLNQHIIELFLEYPFSCGDSPSAYLGDSWVEEVNSHHTPVSRDLLITSIFLQWTPLQFLAWEEEVALVGKLLSKGINPGPPFEQVANEKDEDKRILKQQPIHIAIIKNSLEIVKLLLDRRVDITATNESGYNALELAKLYDRDAIVSALTEYQLKQSKSNTNQENQKSKNQNSENSESDNTPNIANTNSENTKSVN